MRASATAALAIALLMAGCATDTPSTDDPVVESAPDDAGEPDVGASSDTDGDEDREDAEAPTGARVTDEPGEVEIDIRMFDFEDDVVEISVGETVTWTNLDATHHTVTSGVDGEPDGTFEVTFADRGDTASVTFDEPGEYHYFCMPHNFMTGTVIVTG
jgi:plastocyanin